MLLKTSKFFLYASLFAVIVVLTSAFFPFIGGKDYFFRISIELSLVFLMLHAAFGDGVQLPFRETFRRPLVIAVSAFAGVFLLASLFAYDVHAAFWSNYERGEGGFQMLHYYAFFMLLALLLRTPEEWRRLLKVALVAAGIMVLYGVASAIYVPQCVGTQCVPVTQFGLARYTAQGELVPPSLPEQWLARFVKQCDPTTSGCAWENPFDFAGAYVNPAGQLVAPTFFGRLFSPLVRFQGSLGNPAYVAPYLMFAIFYALYLLWSGRPGSRRAWGYGVVAGLALLFLILSQTRGAFLGIGIAVVVFFLYLIAKSEGRVRKQATVALWVFILVNGWLFASLAPTFLGKSPSGVELAVSHIPGFAWITSHSAMVLKYFLPFIDRVYDFGFSSVQIFLVWLATAVVVLSANVIVAARRAARGAAVAVLVLTLVVAGQYAKAHASRFVSIASFETRTWAWQAAWQGFEERPLLGWGPENFSTVFDKYFNPNFFMPGQNTETWFDRAHSLIFDYLVETGIVGLLSFFAMFGVFFYECFRKRPRAAAPLPNRGQRVAPPAYHPALLDALFFALPVGYLVQGIVLFDVLPIYLGVFLFLALASARFAAPPTLHAPAA